MKISAQNLGTVEGTAMLLEVCTRLHPACQEAQDYLAAGVADGKTLARVISDCPHQDWLSWCWKELRPWMDYTVRFFFIRDAAARDPGFAAALDVQCDPTPQERAYLRRLWYGRRDREDNALFPQHERIVDRREAR